jgi:hypothetical protein
LLFCEAYSGIQEAIYSKTTNSGFSFFVKP